MNLIRDVECFLLFVVLTELVCTLVIAEISGQSAENEDLYCGAKHEESDENIGADSSENDGWHAYSVRGQKWPKNTLTYTISKYSKKLADRDAESAIKKAARKWADASLLTLRATSNPGADIKFKFVSSLDDCDTTSFYPGEGKDTIKFSDEKSWTAATLHQAATHELGHALGIRHSTDQSAIMYGPRLTERNGDFSLSSDDVKAIQKLYGSLDSSSSSSDSSSETSSSEDSSSSTDISSDDSTSSSDSSSTTSTSTDDSTSSE